MLGCALIEYLGHLLRKEWEKVFRHKDPARPPAIISPQETKEMFQDIPPEVTAPLARALRDLLWELLQDFECFLQGLLIKRLPRKESSFLSKKYLFDCIPLMKATVWFGFLVQTVATVRFTRFGFRSRFQTVRFTRFTWYIWYFRFWGISCLEDFDEFWCFPPPRPFPACLPPPAAWLHTNFETAVGRKFESLKMFQSFFFGKFESLKFGNLVKPTNCQTFKPWNLTNKQTNKLSNVQKTKPGRFSNLQKNKVWNRSLFVPPWDGFKVCEILKVWKFEALSKFETCKLQTVKSLKFGSVVTPAFKNIRFESLKRW